MQLVYAREPIPESFTKSLFLAGPTPRLEEGKPPGKSWRPAMIAALELAGYDGVVFIPEDRDGKCQFDYTDQVEWETAAMNASDVIVFWIARDIQGGTLFPEGQPMPAFTTNDEWGTWKDSGKCVLGVPEGAVKTSYQQWWAEQLGVPQFDNMTALSKFIVEKIGEGAEREGGETRVPLEIWQRKDFQDWYAMQRKVGNRLDDARVEWAFRVGKKRERLFLYALWVNVYIWCEDRHKPNEVVIIRPDISAAVLHHEGEVVLVREFRSPVRNHHGYVWELPGGSGQAKNPAELVRDEVREETGLDINLDRFVYCGGRQLAATLLAHACQLYKVELTSEEIEKLRDDTSVHGEDESNGEKGTERTTVHVVRVEDLQGLPVDWTTLGLIYLATQGKFLV